MLQQRRLGAENEVTTEGRTGAPEVDPENDRGVMETPRLPTGPPSLRGWQDLVVKATTDTSCPDELTRVILGLREWHDLKINNYCTATLSVLLTHHWVLLNHIKRGLCIFILIE